MAAGSGGRHSIGIDLGGTSFRVGLFGPGGQLLERRSLPTRTERGPQAVVEEMASVARDLIAKESGVASVEGIGIGSPGPLDLPSGSLTLLPNFPGWNGFPLRDRLREATGLPVILDCDANAAALAEWRCGAGKAYAVDSMAIITLGTGVGSGLILNGRIWHGQVGMGGEVGHVSIRPDGLQCTCGGRGCLEMYASANGLIRLALAMAGSEAGTPALKALVSSPGGFTPLQVAELAILGDGSARQAWSELGSALGFALAGLINTLDLPVVVIGGGVAAAWPLFCGSMFSTLREYSYVYRLQQPSQLTVREEGRTFICPAVLGEAAGLLGAALLPGTRPPW